MFCLFFCNSSQMGAWDLRNKGDREGCSCDIRPLKKASQARDQEVSGGTGDSGKENPCKGPEVECALRNSQKPVWEGKKQKASVGKTGTES